MTLVDQIKRDEGRELKPYRDTSEALGFEGRKGKLTIGYGRNLDDHGISADEAEYMLNNDLIDAACALSHALPWSDCLSPARQAVLINMSYNMGIHTLLGFTNTLAAIKNGNYAKAATHMLASKWAKQVGIRAVRLAKQMETDEWQ